MLKPKHRIHDAANIFPMMTEAEFEGLKADIAEHGQREDIVAWCDQIIDGRNRLRACEELGIEPIIADLDEHHDPVAYVISHNLHRRHLSTSQRSMVAAKIANLKEGRPSEETTQNCGVTQEEAAAKLNVSTRSVQAAKQVIKSGNKEVIEAVEQGKMPVSTAANLVLKKPLKKPKEVPTFSTLKQATNPKQAQENFTTVKEDIQEDVVANAVREFKKLWDRCDAVGKKAIRVWIDQNYLN